MDRSSVKLFFVNGGVLGFTTLTETEAILKVGLLAATLVYTLIKCWRLARQKGNDDTIQFTKKD